MNSQINQILQSEFGNYSKWEKIIEYLVLLDNNKSQKEQELYNQLWLLWQMNAQISNGGFSQLFLNFSAKDIELMIRIPEHIGAEHTLNLLSEMYSIIPADLKVDQDKTARYTWDNPLVSQKEAELTGKYYANEVKLADEIISWLKNLSLPLR